MLSEMLGTKPMIAGVSYRSVPRSLRLRYTFLRDVQQALELIQLQHFLCSFVADSISTAIVQ